VGRIVVLRRRVQGKSEITSRVAAAERVPPRLPAFRFTNAAEGTGIGSAARLAQGVRRTENRTAFIRTPWGTRISSAEKVAFRMASFVATVQRTQDLAAFVRATEVAGVAAAKQITSCLRIRTPQWVAVIARAQDRRALIGAARGARVTSGTEWTASRRGTVGLADAAEVARMPAALGAAQGVHWAEDRAAFIRAAWPAWTIIAAHVALAAAAPWIAERIAGTENRAAMIGTADAARVAAAKQITLRERGGTRLGVAVVFHAQDWRALIRATRRASVAAAERAAARGRTIGFADATEVARIPTALCVAQRVRRTRDRVAFERAPRVTHTATAQNDALWRHELAPCRIAVVSQA
jgi:hypothetical protein